MIAEVLVYKRYNISDILSNNIAVRMLINELPLLLRAAWTSENNTIQYKNGKESPFAQDNLGYQFS